MSNVRDFGAAGDGERDDTEAIRHALDQGDGVLEFPPGDYLIHQPIRVELDRKARFGIVGLGGAARVIMDGPGPAFHLIGTHEGSAIPSSVKPIVRDRERLPTVLNLRVEGRHPEADGFLLEGTMQSTFEGVLLTDLRDGIRFRRRCRNVVISHCHIYNNRRMGVFLDNVNLHQIIITGSHISYNALAGIKIEGGEIRNFQFTGNDIEYNDSAPDGAAEILIDCTPEGSTVREGTITGNTIQARASRGGANVRVLGQSGSKSHQAGMLTISDNLLGSQEVNLHLDSCRAVVVTGNVIYSGHQRNVLVDRSRNIVVGPNSFDHNPDYRDKQLATGIRLSDSQDVTLSGLQIQDSRTGEHTVESAITEPHDALIEIVGCQRVTASGLHVLDGAPYGLLVDRSDDVVLTGSLILDTRDEKLSEASIRWQGAGAGNRITACRVDEVQIDDQSGVTQTGNS